MDINNYNCDDWSYYPMARNDLYPNQTNYDNDWTSTNNQLIACEQTKSVRIFQPPMKVDHMAMNSNVDHFTQPQINFGHMVPKVYDLERLVVPLGPKMEDINYLHCNIGLDSSSSYINQISTTFANNDLQYYQSLCTYFLIEYIYY